MTRVVKSKDNVPDNILGIICRDWTVEDVERYVKELEEYYGFPCKVVEIY